MCGHDKAFAPSQSRCVARNASSFKGPTGPAAVIVVRVIDDRFNGQFELLELRPGQRLIALGTLGDDLSDYTDIVVGFL